MKAIFFSLLSWLCLAGIATAQEPAGHPVMIIAFDVSGSMLPLYQGSPHPRLVQFEKLTSAYTEITKTPCLSPHDLVIGYWDTGAVTALRITVYPDDLADMRGRVIPALRNLGPPPPGTASTNTNHLGMEAWIDQVSRDHAMVTIVVTTDEDGPTFAQRDQRIYGVAIPDKYAAQYGHSRGAEKYLLKIAGHQRSFGRGLGGLDAYIADVVRSNLNGTCYLS